MKERQNIIEDIQRIKTNTLNIKREIKTLKDRVRAYKGWTKRYRKQQQELKHTNLVISQQRDEAVQELELKQQRLLETVEEAKQAKELRDKALSQLDEVIAKIEQYKEVCQRANQMTYADKIYLIQEAEKLFFDEEIITVDINFDSKTQSQMLTSQADIGRSLLDR
jgi:hypothetical protein